MPTAPPPRELQASELITLARSHYVEAESSTCPAEQRELHRIADIYTVLATLDLPISIFTEIACSVEAGNRRPVDAVDPARGSPPEAKSER